MFREADEVVQVRPLRQMIAESLSTYGYTLPEDALTACDGQPWHFLTVKTDYAPVHHGECNHWLPAWTKEELGAEFEVRRLQATADIHQQMYEHTKTVQELTQAANQSDDETSGVNDAKMESAMENISLLESQKLCFEALHAAGYCPIDVPADGNCALWSVLALQNGNIGGNIEESVAAIKDLRATLRDLWIQHSTDHLWQQLWEHFGIERELPAEDLAAAAAEAAVTPRPKAAQKVSPEKMSPLKHLDPKKVSECKPANLGKCQTEPAQAQLRQPGPTKQKRLRQMKAETQALEPEEEGQPEAEAEDSMGSRASILQNGMDHVSSGLCFSYL